MLTSIFLYTWVEALLDTSASSTLLPSILALLFFKKQSTPLKYLSYLLWVATVVEISAYILGTYKIPNLPLLHIYVIIEFALLAWMYQLYLYRFYPKYLIPIVIVGFTLLSILNSIFIQTIYTFNTYARALENLLLIVFALSFFYKLLKELKIKYLEKKPIFWINTGILIYFSGSLFIFIFSNFLVTRRELNTQMWIIHAFLNIFHNVFYAIGLWLSRENSE
ncbi:hypothetical protein BKI52_23600 [marine bacterium AO1-C]|nr:hypothetical protein BKI52_23600 [marine bacterium AO1-C]